MSVRADGDSDILQEALGIGGEVQVVPILVPIDTFKLLLDAGRARGMSVSDVMAKAIELFLHSKQDINTNKEETKPVRAPDVVFRRKR